MSDRSKPIKHNKNLIAHIRAMSNDTHRTYCWLVFRSAWGPYGNAILRFDPSIGADEVGISFVAFLAALNDLAAKDYIDLRKRRNGQLRAEFRLARWPLAAGGDPTQSELSQIDPLIESAFESGTTA